VPVSYRVSISGFTDEERQDLAACFARRSLIAYQPSPDPAHSELLIIDADLPQTFHQLGDRLRPANALYVGHSMPHEARWYVPRPIEPALVLRMLDELVATERPAPHRFVDYFSDMVHATPSVPALDPALRRRLAGLDASGPSTVPAAMPLAVEDTMFGDLDGEHFADGAANGTSEGAEWVSALVPQRRTWPGGADRRAEKASQRAAVRRAQMADSRRGYASLPSVTHALVMDSHPPSRLETGVLLSTFGFQAQTVSSVAEAERALWTKPFAVAFLGEPADGPQETAGIELCHRIKQGAYGSPYLKPKIVMVANRPRPVDPVRARLAGCDHFVSGPTSRGLVAQALEAVSVAMPKDPRQAR
jgi:CheY-like chemotaxis protein